ncbi:hypothetical protein [Thalassospira sp.]|uniref:hypothetical protein n=1 Tax=Thalassospira sp. TaxID=1912094 RepID=UPI00257F7B6C|nr:hypothetical protein [Thalassospira sp.]|tara:strand:- start:1815 stop:1991 length:177 start_codon:yes stop_codon:yes gene_type:complete
MTDTTLTPFHNKPKWTAQDVEAIFRVIAADVSLTDRVMAQDIVMLSRVAGKKLSGGNE